MQINIGNSRSPGPGFLPFWSGVILFGLATLLLVTSLKTKNKAEKLTSLWKGMRWDKVVSTLISLFIYVFLLPRMGFVIMTFALMIFLFRVTGNSKLWIQVISALITVSLAHVIFSVWLGIPLPKGMFGF